MSCVAILLLAAGCGVTATSSPASRAPALSSPSRTPRFTIVSAIPEGAGMEFLTNWNHWKGRSSRTFALSDFRRVHFEDHGTRFTFILKSANILLHSTPPLPKDEPELRWNRPIRFTGNAWVREAVFSKAGQGVQVTLSLAHSATHFTTGTDPMAFIFTFGPAPAGSSPSVPPPSPSA